MSSLQNWWSIDWCPRLCGSVLNIRDCGIVQCPLSESLKLPIKQHISSLRPKTFRIDSHVPYLSKYCFDRLCTLQIRQIKIIFKINIHICNLWAYSDVRRQRPAESSTMSLRLSQNFHSNSWWPLFLLSLSLCTGTAGHRKIVGPTANVPSQKVQPSHLMSAPRD